MRPLMLLLALAMPAHADDRALLIGIEAYDTAGSIPGAGGALDAGAPLTEAGFVVISGRI